VRAQPARRAGNQRDLAVEIEHVSCGPPLCLRHE
jgi:hypothetical protein